MLNFVRSPSNRHFADLWCFDLWDQTSLRRLSSSDLRSTLEFWPVCQGKPRLPCWKSSFSTYFLLFSLVFSPPPRLPCRPDCLSLWTFQPALFWALLLLWVRNWSQAILLLYFEPCQWMELLRWCFSAWTACFSLVLDHVSSESPRAVLSPPVCYGCAYFFLLPSRADHSCSGSRCQRSA